MDLTWNTSPAVIKGVCLPLFIFYSPSLFQCDTMGCTRIDNSNVDPSSSVSYEGCDHGSAAFKDGCTVTIKCINKSK